jgi:hypothetical protein
MNLYLVMNERRMWELSVLYGLGVARIDVKCHTISAAKVILAPLEQV